MNFPILLGSHLAKPSEWARLPRPKLCIYGGSGEIFSPHFANKISTGNRNPQGDAVEAEERVAAGRRYCPEAVTGQKAGYQTADALWTKAPIRFPARKFANIATLKLPRPSLQGCGNTVVRAEFKIAATTSATQAAEAPDIARSWRHSHSFRSETRKRQSLPTWRPFDLASAGLLLKRLWMNAKKSGGFDGIEQRLEFGYREARLSRNLSRPRWECDTS